MRTIMLLWFCLSATICRAQFEKPVVIQASGLFNIGLKGLGTDDAGLGLQLQAAFFARKKLQLVAMAGTNLFFGNKALYENPLTGKVAKTRIHSLGIGPQVQLSRRWALAATYGPTWHKVRKFDYRVDHSFRFALTSYFGKQRRFFLQGAVHTIGNAGQSVQFVGLGLGYRR